MKGEDIGRQSGGGKEALGIGIRYEASFIHYRSLFAEEFGGRSDGGQSKNEKRSEESQQVK